MSVQQETQAVPEGRLFFWGCQDIKTCGRHQFIKPVESLNKNARADFRLPAVSCRSIETVCTFRRDDLEPGAFARYAGLFYGNAGDPKDLAGHEQPDAP